MTGNEEIVLLVNTGADISLCKRSKINQGQLVDRQSAIKIKGVTEGLASSIGTTETQLFVQNYALNHTFHIVDENFPIPSDGILGRDFITKYQC